MFPSPFEKNNPETIRSINEILTKSPLVGIISVDDKISHELYYPMRRKGWYTIWIDGDDKKTPSLSHTNYSIMNKNSRVRDRYRDI